MRHFKNHWKDNILNWFGSIIFNLLIYILSNEIIITLKKKNENKLQNSISNKYNLKNETKRKNQFKKEF
jgi:hypothetical protein